MVIVAYPVPAVNKTRRRRCCHTRARAYSPDSIGHSFPTSVIPPEPKYCPMATSWKNIGMPQNNMAMKYVTKNAPDKIENKTTVQF